MRCAYDYSFKSLSLHPIASTIPPPDYLNERNSRQLLNFQNL